VSRTLRRRAPAVPDTPYVVTDARVRNGGQVAAAPRAFRGVRAIRSPADEQRSTAARWMSAAADRAGSAPGVGHLCRASESPGQHRHPLEGSYLSGASARISTIQRVAPGFCRLGSIGETRHCRRKFVESWQPGWGPDFAHSGRSRPAASAARRREPLGQAHPSSLGVGSVRADGVGPASRRGWMFASLSALETAPHTSLYLVWLDRADGEHGASESPRAAERDVIATASDGRDVRGGSWAVGCYGEL